MITYVCIYRSELRSVVGDLRAADKEALDFPPFPPSASSAAARVAAADVDRTSGGGGGLVYTANAVPAYREELETRGRIWRRGLPQRGNRWHCGIAKKQCLRNVSE